MAKGKKSGVLITANKELAFQNQEKEKQANEVIHANKALVASENRYRRLFEAAQDGILILNADTGMIEDVNPFMIEMLGYSYNEFLGKELWEIGLFSDINANKQAFIKLKEEGYIRYKDLPLKTKHGLAISVEFVSNRYDVSGGQVIQCNIRNISERKIAEENNKRLSERLLLATQSAKLGIWDWDIKNNVLNWDKGMYLLYDMIEVEFESVYEGWIKRVHPEDMEWLNNAMQQALLGKEDYNPTFRLIWRDSSVHYIEASGLIERDAEGIAIRMIGANWDITLQKEKERHLKLLESVITNTTDSVLITEAEPFDEPGTRIIYVNEAFTKMTGYTSEEVIGKTPRILQGPKSDRVELKRLSEAIRRWESCEITTINYKKNGEEFWINFILTPVANEKGWYTHWIAIERDVTIRKNEELQNDLITDINTVFSEPLKINETLDKILRLISTFCDFCFTEAWLTSRDQNMLHKISSYASTENSRLFLEETNSEVTFKYGEGFPNIVSKTKEIIICGDFENQKLFLPRDAALKYGLKTIIGLPLLYNNEVTGVLVFGLDHEIKDTARYKTIFKKIGDYLSPEIKRKQLEIELNQMFNFAPDLIVIIGLDGYFKRVNPAATKILGYNQEEICAEPYMNFIHPEDREKTKIEVAKLLETKLTDYFENRHITKSGKIKRLSWNAIYVSEDNSIYAVAKDITEKKELEKLFKKTNELARIGGWELDLQNNTLLWSDFTKEIHEVTPDYIPDLEAGIAFYKKGSNRNRITEYLQQAKSLGKSWDDEFQFVTAKGNERWVRAVGEAEFVNENCLRIYGSLKDITERKIAAEEQEKLTNDIIQRNRDLEQFTFIISHNLRAPTANIIGFTEILQDETLSPEEQKESLKGLSNSVAGLDAIIKDINSILQVKREINEKKELISFSKLVDSILISIGDAIDKNHVRFKLDFTEVDKIFSLKVYMHSIFYNLISNSIKYRKLDEQTLIEIKSKKEDGKIILTFKDNGLGIDMKTKGDKVFGLYRRFHSHVEGKGMGLFMIKTQVEAIGGTISVASELNKGTEFTITLIS